MQARAGSPSWPVPGCQCLNGRLGDLPLPPTIEAGCAIPSSLHKSENHRYLSALVTSENSLRSASTDLRYPHPLAPKGLR